MKSPTAKLGGVGIEPQCYEAVALKSAASGASCLPSHWLAEPHEVPE
jgi:hypothetical protein